MAKITGPLMSLDASGSIASTITFSKWKGRNYVRQLVKPSNPKSPAQTAFRAMFGFLSSIWKTMSGGQQGSWDTLAAATNVSPFNAFTQANQKRWTQTLTPGANNPVTESDAAGDVSALNATAGVRQIELTVTDGTPRQNWGLIIYRSQTPAFSPTQNDVIAVVAWDDTAPLNYVDSGLTPGTYYYVTATFSLDGVRLLDTHYANATAT